MSDVQRVLLVASGVAFSMLGSVATWWTSREVLSVCVCVRVCVYVCVCVCVRGYMEDLY